MSSSSDYDWDVSPYESDVKSATSKPANGDREEHTA